MKIMILSKVFNFLFGRIKKSKSEKSKFSSLTTNNPNNSNSPKPLESLEKTLNVLKVSSVEKELDVNLEYLHLAVKKLYVNKHNLEIFNLLRQYTKEYNITNFNNLAFFYANLAVESRFKHFVENMNYTKPERLREVYPSYFKKMTDEEIKPFLNAPLKLGNLVYGYRMGNNGQEGYKYRGRGCIQVTGKNNYRRCLKFLNLENFLETPVLLENFNFYALSAIWYWKEYKCDKCLTLKETVKKVSGGNTFNLKEKEKELEKILTMYNKLKS